MGITEFIKAKNLGEYLESRKNGQVRERIPNTQLVGGSPPQSP